MASTWGTSWGTSWATSWTQSGAVADPYLNYYNSRNSRSHDAIAKKKVIKKKKRM